MLDWPGRFRADLPRRTPGICWLTLDDDARSAAGCGRRPSRPLPLGAAKKGGLSVDGRRRRAAAPGPASARHGSARRGVRGARRPARAARRPPAATAGTCGAPRRRRARGIATPGRARPHPSTTTAGARLASTAGRRGCLSRGGMSACAIPASTSAGSCARSAATLAGGVSTDSVRGEPLRFWDARAISSSLMGSCAFLERIKQW